MSIKDDTAHFREPSKPRLLSIKQAVYELGISRTAVYELITAGKIKTDEASERIAYLSVDVRYLDQQVIAVLLPNGSFGKLRYVGIVLIM